MIWSSKKSVFTVKKKRRNASRHQWIENPLHQSPQMTLCLEVRHWRLPNGVQGQDMGTGGEWNCDDLERRTCVDATIMETRTSAAHPQQRQATNHWWCTTHHTPQCTPQHALPHGCMLVERLNDHTVFGFTVCFHCKLRHQEQHCVGQQPDWCQHWWCHLWCWTGQRHMTRLTTVIWRMWCFAWDVMRLDCRD